jgi:hypothetical protein
VHESLKLLQVPVGDVVAEGFADIGLAAASGHEHEFDVVVNSVVEILVVLLPCFITKPRFENADVANLSFMNTSAKFCESGTCSHGDP